MLKYILSTALSYESYEKLARKSREKSFTELLQNYQKYWNYDDGKWRYG